MRGLATAGPVMRRGAHSDVNDLLLWCQCSLAPMLMADRIFLHRPSLGKAAALDVLPMHAA
jgi:hypothetical protein